MEKAGEKNCGGTGWRLSQREREREREREMQVSVMLKTLSTFIHHVLQHYQHKGGKRGWLRITGLLQVGDEHTGPQLATIVRRRKVHQKGVNLKRG